MGDDLERKLLREPIENSMPTIAYFLEISVRMFFNDHGPPHFHARYQGFRARIRIADGERIDGRLPPTVRRLAKEWTGRDALIRNWRLARTEEELEKIGGLDDD
jgi:hypothetical protein